MRALVTIFTCFSEISTEESLTSQTSAWMSVMVALCVVLNVNMGVIWNFRIRDNINCVLAQSWEMNIIRITVVRLICSNYQYLQSHSAWSSIKPDKILFNITIIVRDRNILFAKFLSDLQQRDCHFHKKCLVDMKTSRIQKSLFLLNLQTNKY